MPSGKTHDAITFLLAAPTFAAAYSASGKVSAAAVVAAAFVFGGLMFGPDLDTVSKQYSRWWIIRGLWFPYRSFFKHRSRFSHGLIFGSLIRVVYFMCVITLIAFVLSFAYSASIGGKTPDINDLARTWQPIGTYTREKLGENVFVLSFVGLWLGAASHTFTDMAGSFVRTGRIAKFL